MTPSSANTPVSPGAPGTQDSPGTPVRPGEPDEFSFLAGEAAELGLSAVPEVRRVSTDAVSGLLWGIDPVEVVWLHGAGLNAHTWDGTIMAMGAPSLAIDLPGHGDSAWRSDADYSARTNVTPVASLIRDHVADPVVVVGHSLGGLTALALAQAHPDLVHALVIIDITPGLVVEAASQVRDFLAGPKDFASRDEIVDRAEAFGFGTSREALRRGVFLNTIVRPDGRVVFKHHLANLAQGQAALPDDFAALWPDAEGVQVPVLLVRASRGFLTDGWEAEFVTRVNEATAVRIDAGHNVQEDAPRELAAQISAFLGHR